jgi:hypothetical protein
MMDAPASASSLFKQRPSFTLGASFAIIAVTIFIVVQIVRKVFKFFYKRIERSNEILMEVKEIRQQVEGRKLTRDSAQKLADQSGEVFEIIEDDVRFLAGLSHLYASNGNLRSSNREISNEGQKRCEEKYEALLKFNYFAIKKN